MALGGEMEEARANGEEGREEDWLGPHRPGNMPANLKAVYLPCLPPAYI